MIYFEVYIVEPLISGPVSQVVVSYINFLTVFQSAVMSRHSFSGSVSAFTKLVVGKHMEQNKETFLKSFYEIATFSFDSCHPLSEID